MVAGPSFSCGTFNLVAWLSLEGLPIHFFNKAALFSIATAIGSPLKIDEATANLTRPSIARICICIKVDLLKHLPQQIWIGTSSASRFWQDVCYENFPHIVHIAKKWGIPLHIVTKMLEIIISMERRLLLQHPSQILLFVLL